jgi:hypothetical protein
VLREVDRFAQPTSRPQTAHVVAVPIAAEVPDHPVEVTVRLGSLAGLRRSCRPAVCD